MSKRKKRELAYEKLGNKSLHKPIAIAVEGVDWFHFLLEQIKEKPEFKDVQLFDFGSVTQLDAFLDVFRAELKFGQLRALGIIRDVEEFQPKENDEDVSEDNFEIKDNRENVINSVRDVLLKYDFSAPNEPMSINNEKSIAVSYLIIPDGAETGCLEHAILDSVKDEQLLKCAQDFYDCIDPNRTRTDNARAKMIVRSIIATTRKDGYTLGQSVHADLWDLEHESVRVMLDFIRSLTSLVD